MICAILTDVEGTTSDVAFVKEVLFPYARAHLPRFIREHADDPEVREQLAATRSLAGESDAGDGRVVQILCAWIDEDRKETPLKALQGLVWKEGYLSGAYRAHVYPDAAAQLRAWKGAGLALYVYSSGSVAAQRLFFGHSIEGDLTPVFDGYFDTSSGSKQEPSSYAKIAADIAAGSGSVCAPADILFLSDTTAELDAARAAGLSTIWVLREGEPNPAVDHSAVSRLDEIRSLDLRWTPQPRPYLVT